METLTGQMTITHMFAEHTEFVTATRENSTTFAERLRVG